MKQRVVMVLSTLLDPSLLVADELTSALDVSTQQAVAEMLVEFRERGFVKSMIVITHDLAILYQIADTIIVMYAGKLVEKGAGERDRRRPAASVHALLLGSLPEAGARFDESRLTGIAGRPPSLLDPPRGLPLPRPLPARVREVRGGAAVRRVRARPPGRVLEGGRLMLRLEGVHEGVQGRHVRRQAHRSPSRDVTFDIRPGEVVSLIGESGSGKTSIGRMVLRLTDVTRGSIMFDGRDISGSSGRGLRATTPTCRASSRIRSARTTPIFKADRVFELIRRPYLPRRSATTSGAAKLEASLEAVGLEPGGVLGKYPHQLSGGQLQRLLIARALLLDIRLLVADEIISMLDASTRIDVLNLLGDLAVARARHPLHHARPLARQLHQRPHGDPAPRARRRDWGDTEGLLRTRGTRTRRCCSTRCRSCNTRWSDGGRAARGASADDGGDRRRSSRSRPATSSRSERA